MAEQPAQHRTDIAKRLRQVREHSLALAAPLSAEDQCLQSMPDASPTDFFPPAAGWQCSGLRLARDA